MQVHSLARFALVCCGSLASPGFAAQHLPCALPQTRTSTLLPAGTATTDSLGPACAPSFLENATLYTRCIVGSRAAPWCYVPIRADGTAEDCTQPGHQCTWAYCTSCSPCSAADSNGHPTTSPGATSTVACPGGWNGSRTQRCGGDSLWEAEDFSACVNIAPVGAYYTFQLGQCAVGYGLVTKPEAESRLTDICTHASSLIKTAPDTAATSTAQPAERRTQWPVVRVGNRGNVTHQAGVQAGRYGCSYDAAACTGGCEYSLCKQITASVVQPLGHVFQL